jgi:glutathione S-transferase
LAPPERKRAVGYGSYEETIDALETAVKGKRFIAGDRFSAADVYAGSQIGWGLRFGTIEARPAFTEYWAGMEQRPALKRAAELDDAALSVARHE